MNNTTAGGSELIQKQNIPKMTTTTNHDIFVLKVNAEAYLKPSQIFKMEYFTKIVNG